MSAGAGRLTAADGAILPPKGSPARPADARIAQVLAELRTALQAEAAGKAEVSWGNGEIQVALTRYRKFRRP